MNTICRLAARSASKIVLMILLASAPGWGINFESEEVVHISNLHRIDDDLLAWGSAITVDGLIEGDLIAGGYTVNTNGHIKGSENVFAFKFHHTGKTDGALRGFCNLSEVDGYVGRSVLLLGNDIRIGEKAVIEKDIILTGATAYFDGLAKGDAEINADVISVSGIISGDAVLKGNRIKVVAPAVIKGNLTYVSPDKADLDVASGVTILGETEWSPPKGDGEDDVSGVTSTVVEVSKLLAALLFGIILLFLFNKYAVEAVNQLKNRPAVSIATGLLSLMVFVVSVLILVVSGAFVLIGLALVYGDGAPLGALVLSLSFLMVPITSFITVSGAVLFYSGKIAVALLAGYLVVKIMKPGAVYLSRFQLLLGLIILTFLFSIPYLGLLLYFVISISGAGAIVLGIKYCRRELNYEPAPPPPTGKETPSEPA